MNFSKQLVSILLVSLVFIVNTGCNDSNVWQEPFPERLTISVVDSIGIETGDSCYVLGSIADAEVSPSGDILLLDKSIYSIRKYTPEGIHLCDISRHGNGPGELLYPFSMTVTPDGSIMVGDMHKSSIVVLSETGESLEELSDWFLFQPTSITAPGENLFAGCEMNIDMTGSHMLIIVKPSLYSFSSSSPEYSYMADTLMFNLDGSDAPVSVGGMTDVTLMASDLDGRIFYSRKSSSEGAVHCWDIEGTPLFSVSSGISPVAKTEQEILDETEYTRMQFAALGANGLPGGFEPDPYHILVENIGVDSEGNLWVQRGTEANPVFDVFDETGVHVATAEYPRAGKFWEFSITPYGSLAWNNDPLSGIQKLYMIDLPCPALQKVQSD
jgi:hypothetical protein